MQIKKGLYPLFLPKFPMPSPKKHTKGQWLDIVEKKKGLGYQSLHPHALHLISSHLQLLHMHLQSLHSFALLLLFVAFDFFVVFFAIKSIQSNCDYKRKPAFIKVSVRLQKSIYFIAQNAY
jgi:hypothetical protein